MRFDGAYGVYVVRVASVLNSGIYFGTFFLTIIPQYITKFAMEQDYVQLGLNVSITV